ncbi:MAG: hypothetical protein J5857_09700 [Treponema sp.]|nr:hypothetical protein [Treponema sp.]
MRKGFIISLLVFFSPALFFGVTFNDMSFEEFYNQEAREYVKEESNPWWNDDDIDEFEQKLKIEFSEKHSMAKEFFKSIPEDYTVTPVLHYEYNDEGDIIFPYTLNIQEDTLAVYLFDFSKDEKGLHGRAEVFFDSGKDSAIDLYFDDFYIQNDGTFASGFSYDDDEYYENCYINTNGMFINLFKSYLEKAEDGYRTVSLSPALYTEAFYDKEKDMEQVRIGKTVFDSDCRIISCDPYNEPQKIDESEWTYGAVLTSVIWISESNLFHANGSIDISSLNIHEEFNDYEIIITQKRLSIADRKEINFNYNGYPMSTRVLLLEHWRLSTDFTDIHINDRTYSLSLNFKCSSSDSDWFLDGTSKKVAEEEEFDHYLCEDDLVLEYLMDSDGLKVTFKSRFPKGAEYMDTYQFLIKPDGSMEYLYIGSSNKMFGIGNEYSNKMFGIGLTALKAEIIYWNNDTHKINIGYPTFLFPDYSMLGPVGYAFSNLRMDMDGNFEIYKDTHLPRSTTFFGKTIILNHFEFADDGIIMSGTLYIPEKLQSAIISSRVEVERLYVGYDGGIRELVSKSDNKSTSYFSESSVFVYTANGNHLEIEHTENKPECWVYLDDSKLLVSQRIFTADSDIQLKNVRFSFSTGGDADYDSIYIPGGFSITLNGMKYDVSEGKFTDIQVDGETRKCLEFTGDMRVSEDNRVPFVMDIDFDGILQRLQLEKDGKAIELKTLNRIFRLL